MENFLYKRMFDKHSKGFNTTLFISNQRQKEFINKLNFN